MVRGVALKAVLQLRRVRRGRHVQHPLLRGNVRPVAKGQIAGGQGLQVHHGPASVGQHVEELHGDPVPIVEHPEAAAPHLLLGHEGQGVGVVLLDPGRGLHLLQIIPEDTPPKPQIKGREPGHELVHRLLQKGRVHRLRQGDGLAKQVAPVLPPDGGKDEGRVVQGHPNLAHRVTSRKQAAIASRSARRSLRS